MPRQPFLLTPGPTQVPGEVLEALARPVIHHRSPEFKSLFARVRARLREVFRTESEVLVTTSSGTGAFESAIVNLLSPGEPVVAVSHGNFGERWQKMAAAYGADVHRITYAWGDEPRPDELAAALEASGARVALVVHSETSTGVVSDVQALAAACRASGALCVVDAISSLGAVPLEADAWGIDVVVTGSQKALMCPPGLGFVSVSDRARERAREATMPRFYWDWERALTQAEKDNTPFTPAVSTIVALDVALARLLGEGLEHAFARHVALGRACRAAIHALGLELYSPDDDRAAVLTAALTPPGVDAVALRLALRDRHGITIAGGHGEIVDRLFRLGHIGHVGIDEVAVAVAALEEELALLDVAVEPGRAEAAARSAYTAAVGG
ncbi:MAG: pyridoxal-phosphate-dependent aminotransferase family protein [Gaiella sp.]